MVYVEACEAGRVRRREAPATADTNSLIPHQRSCFVNGRQDIGRDISFWNLVPLCKMMENLGFVDLPLCI